MKNRILRALGLVAVCVVAACAAPRPEAPADRFVVGTAGPMSGVYAAFGTQMRAGAEQAVEDINAAGGVLGKPLVLEVGDDLCDPRRAVSVANTFARRGVVFVAGHFCSGSSIPAAQVYARENIAMISPASSNPKLTDMSLANVFRVFGRDDLQGIVAGDYLAKTFANRNIAILHDGTKYGEGLARIAKGQLNRRGVTEAIYQRFSAGKSDYSALVSQLKSAGIDVVYLGGYHTEAALIIREARNQDYKPKLLAADALVTGEFWAIAGAAGDGTMMTFAPDPRRNPEASAVVRKFRERYVEPDGFTLFTYAAIQAWAQAAAKAGSTDIGAITASLRSNRFDTVLGRIGFDDKGDVVGMDVFVWYIWRNGRYDQM